MKCSIDLHIHTAVSPCGDDLMTPNNIVNMSLLKGLNVIAITDHQTVDNCSAVIKAGNKKGLIVIPGMEIEGKEEFHLICLFRNIQSGKEMEAWIKSYMPPVFNIPEKFGHQYIFDEHDEVIGEEDRFLLISANVETEKIVDKAEKLNCVIYPAHIDRNSYSIISNLGSIPQNLNFSTLELSQNADINKYKKIYGQYNFIKCSDAHYLQNIGEEKQEIHDTKLVNIINHWAQC